MKIHLLVLHGPQNLTPPVSPQIFAASLYSGNIETNIYHDIKRKWWSNYTLSFLFRMLWFSSRLKITNSMLNWKCPNRNNQMTTIFKRLSIEILLQSFAVFQAKVAIYLFSVMDINVENRLLKLTKSTIFDIFTLKNLAILAINKIKKCKKTELAVQDLWTREHSAC